MINLITRSKKICRFGRSLKSCGTIHCPLCIPKEKLFLTLYLFILGWLWNKLCYISLSVLSNAYSWWNPSNFKQGMRGERRQRYAERNNQETIWYHFIMSLAWHGQGLNPRAPNQAANFSPLSNLCIYLFQLSGAYHTIHIELKMYIGENLILLNYSFNT